MHVALPALTSCTWHRVPDEEDDDPDDDEDVVFVIMKDFVHEIKVR